MNAGRELDALVAEKVMGIAVIWKDGRLLMLSSINKENQILWHVPHYSTDIAAAWEVMEKLPLSGESQGEQCHLAIQRSYGSWVAGYVSASGRFARSELAETAPLAICQLALAVATEQILL